MNFKEVIISESPPCRERVSTSVGLTMNLHLNHLMLAGALIPQIVGLQEGCFCTLPWTCQTVNQPASAAVCRRVCVINTSCCLYTVHVPWQERRGQGEGEERHTLIKSRALSAALQRMLPYNSRGQSPVSSNPSLLFLWTPYNYGGHITHTFHSPMKGRSFLIKG